MFAKPEEVVTDPSVFGSQIYLGHEILLKARLPIREDELGLTRIDAIKGEA